MDLMGGYLLVLLVLFAANIALLFGNNKINNLKLIAISAIFTIITFILINASNNINLELLDYFGYIFLIISILTFAMMVYCTKNNNIKVLNYSILVIFIISVILLSSQANLNVFNSLSYSLLFFIILFVVFQLTRLLHHAKRKYPVLIGEYMTLESILIFLFALTYNSTLNLNYTMFSSFLILTPTYQLIYVIIGVIVVLVVGVLINDTRGK
ncbi:MAG: peptide ABC transporter permease [Methanobrevibacter sp.]|uniref:peptide ABC transporter permease n=1 Tax=Methanobrevibacter sp. TaxID=66852 RepID=UPI0025DECDAE|nr:peptide ABC transporter permease [Methanobrevibacter sp.]MBQ8016541.1 peptide ABC transporter permease [Methanobrevibacter sp.]